METSELVPWIAAAAAWSAVLAQLLVGTKFFESWRKDCKRKKLLSMAEKQADQIIKAKGWEPREVLQKRAKDIYGSEVPFYVFEEESMENIEVSFLVFYLLFGPRVRHKPSDDKTFRGYYIHRGNLEGGEKAIFKTAADLLSVRGNWRCFKYALFVPPDSEKAKVELLEIAYAPEETTAINRTDEKRAFQILKWLLSAKDIGSEKDSSANRPENS